jgi:dipeptidyl aminopeptidase/acylaminoacyl peptidase
MMAEKKPVEIMDLAEIKTPSAPQISPDGRRIVYGQTRMDFEEDEYVSDLWMADLDGGTVTQFTAGRCKDKNPFWSPDGRYIAFTSTPKGEEGDEKKKPQLYIIDTRGGEARKITDIETGVSSPRWSPDGETLLFTSRVKPGGREEKKEEDEGEGERDVKVITRLKYRFNGPGFFEGKRVHLFTVPREGGEVKQITDGMFDVNLPGWMPDNRTVVFSGNLEEDADKVGKEYIYKVDIGDGNPIRLSETLMSITGISPSPMGGEISFVGHDFRKGSGSIQDVWRLSVEGGEAERLTGGLDRDIGTKLSCDVRVTGPGVNPTWMGDYIYFTSTFQGDAPLFRIHRDGGEAEEVLGGTDHSVEAFSINDGGVIAYTLLATDKPIELWVRDAGGSRQVTHLNQGYMEETSIQGHTRFTFQSNAGHEVEGWLMTPPGFQGDEKIPLILHIHGGPRGAYGNSFFHEFQVLAAHGWAVLYINPYGSGGYWEDFQAGLPGHYFEQDYDDLMKAVDEVMTMRSWVDEQRLGVTGGSYGGVMTNWIITQTDRFKSAVTLRSICNWYSFFGCSDIGWTFGKREIGGTPWDDEGKFMAKSPIRYVKNVKTPTLIIHSEEDYRCPMEQGEQLYTALKYLGVETEFVRFPKEHHGLSREGKPKHRRERLEHILRWFNKYLS